MIRGLHTVDSCGNCIFVHRRWNGDNTDTLYCYRTTPPALPDDIGNDPVSEEEADAYSRKCEKRMKWELAHTVYETTICVHHKAEKK